jgi:hypothetical protein
MKMKCTLSALALVLAGCATAPQQSQQPASGYQRVPAASSTANIPGGIWFGLAGPGRPTSVDYRIVKVDVQRWRSTSAGQHGIDNATAYVALHGPNGGPRLVPLESLSRLELLSSRHARAVTEGETIDGVNSVQLLACPASVPRPAYRDCLYAERGKAHTLFDDSRYRGMPDFEDKGNASSVFWGHIGLTDGKPGSTYASGVGQAELASSYSRQVAAVQAREAEDKRKKQEDEKRREEEGRRQQAEYLRSARPGSTIFCVSNFLLGSGAVISSLSYDCDAPNTGVPLKSVRLGTLLENKWTIASETRRPRQGYLGVGDEVSLQLVKQR